MSVYACVYVKDDYLIELNLGTEVSISNHDCILQFFILEGSFHFSLRGCLLLSHRDYFKKGSLSFLYNSLIPQTIHVFEFDRVGLPYSSRFPSLQVTDVTI